MTKAIGDEKSSLNFSNQINSLERLSDAFKVSASQIEEMRKQGKKLPDEFALADVILQIKEVSKAAADFNNKSGKGLATTINDIIQAYAQLDGKDITNSVEQMKKA